MGKAPVEEADSSSRSPHQEAQDARESVHAGESAFYSPSLAEPTRHAYDLGGFLFAPQVLEDLNQGGLDHLPYAAMSAQATNFQVAHILSREFMTARADLKHERLENRKLQDKVLEVQQECGNAIHDGKKKNKKIHKLKAKVKDLESRLKARDDEVEDFFKSEQYMAQQAQYYTDGMEHVLRFMVSREVIEPGLDSADAFLRLEAEEEAAPRTSKGEQEGEASEASSGYSPDE